MIDPNAYLRAVERNCPGLRMTAEEREEVRRLFRVAIDEASAEHQRRAAEAMKALRA